MLTRTIRKRLTTLTRSRLCRARVAGHSCLIVSRNTRRRAKLQKVRTQGKEVRPALKHSVLVALWAQLEPASWQNLQELSVPKL